MATNTIPVAKTVIKRAWHDIEPKLVAGLITGLISGQVVTLIVSLLAGTQFAIPTEVAANFTTIAYSIGGWLKSSNALTLDPTPSDPDIDPAA